MALYAGALGVVLLIVGLVANANRPDTTTKPTAALGTPVAVVTPDVVALDPEAWLSFSGVGALEAHTARNVDAEAWLINVTATYVSGLADWETLTTRGVESVVPSPSPSTSPSASPEPSASAEPTASPTASATATTTSTEVSPSATPSPEATASPDDTASPDAEASPTSSATASPTADAAVEPEELEDPSMGSTDLWRQSWNGTNTLTIKAGSVEPGTTLVVLSGTTEPLATATVTLEREVQDEWITPLIWWGAALSIMGLIALVFRLLDVRPVQARIEEWMAHRTKSTRGVAEVRPGSRRERRVTGEGLYTGEIPVDEVKRVEPPGDHVPDDHLVTDQALDSDDSTDQGGAR